MTGTDAVPIRMVRADNPSALTGSGTNTWIVGRGRVAVIDPGPALPAHLDAILSALGPEEVVSKILVTHAHRDHSAVARPLAGRTGAPVLAYGPHYAGRSAVMRRLLAEGLEAGGEGADTEFVPDRELRDGDVVEADGWTLGVWHMPGHMGGHLCFSLGGTLFSGDHVMGWSTSIVSPPDGDMGAYMASLARLSEHPWQRFLPGHGDPVEDPAARLSELLAHRRQREAEILGALRDGPATARTIAERVYASLAPGLLAAASRNVLAHLIDLAERKRVRTPDPLTSASHFEIL